MGNIITSNNSQNPVPDLSTQPMRSPASKTRSVFIGIITFIILFGLVSIFIYQRYTIAKKEQDDEALRLATDAKARLQESLAYSLSATRTLSFFVQQDGSVKDFDTI